LVSPRCEVRTVAVMVVAGPQGIEGLEAPCPLLHFVASLPSEIEA